MKTKITKIEELGNRNARVSKTGTNSSQTSSQDNGSRTPKPDTRLPIDGALRDSNRRLDTDHVLDCLTTLLPQVADRAEVVGSWVWVHFDSAPAPKVRQELSQLGFHWNANRQAWQHPCGKFSLGARASDPRETYASKPAVEAFN